MPSPQKNQLAWIEFTNKIRTAATNASYKDRANAITRIYDQFLIGEHSDENDLLTTKRFIDLILNAIPQHVELVAPKQYLLADGIERLCRKIEDLNGGEKRTEPICTTKPAELRESRIPDPPLDGVEHSLLGVGGFGAVFSPALPNYKNGAWHSYPNNVTKAFKTPAAQSKAISDSARIYGLTGNSGHQVEMYKYRYSPNELPASLKAKFSSEHFFPNGSSYIRMPYLGVEVGKVESVKDKLQKVPFGRILEQIVKVISQVKKIIDHDLVHADIRDSNILINPENGVITIIDFDLLNDTSSLFSRFDFDFYNNPPEFLLFKTRSDLASVALTPESIRALMTNFHIDKPAEPTNPYPDQLLNHYNFWSSLGLTRDSLIAKIIDANVKNANYMKSAAFSSIDDAFKTFGLKTFDEFGLACSLLNLLNGVYPGCIKSETVTPADTVSLRDSLKGVITLESAAYTDAQLGAISSALLELTNTVLLPMMSFTMENRIMTDEALARVMAIKARFDSEFTAVASPEGGSSRRYKSTRKRLNRRRRTTRRFKFIG